MANPKELLEELKLVFAGRSAILDSLLPPLLFIIINTLFGFTTALRVSMGISLLIFVLRLARRQSLWYALGGMAAAALAIGVALLFDRAEAYFLPTLVSGALTTFVLAVSILVKRPAMALTSHLTRRWPLAWYWHPNVRPAYSDVTLFWAIYSGIKFAFQFYLYNRGMANTLAIFNLASGWPVLILLLVISYTYGLKRLRKLKGPSVEEFKEKLPPPWQGQQRGF